MASSTRHDSHRRAWSRRLVGVGPAWSIVGALVSITLVVVVLGQFDGEPSRGAAALLLVLPVIGAAAVGGRVPGYLAAGAATLAFSLSLPPLGSVRVYLAEDVVALGVFVMVAVVGSTLVTSRIDAMAEADQQRSMLLRSVSHDLRTPLASIRAAATELLHGPPHEEDAQHRLLELVETEAMRLDSLVANLLTLGRIETGAMEPRRVGTDVAKLIEAAAQNLELTHPAVGLEVDLAAPLPMVQLDPTQVEQVLTNLLDNAARHSPSGGAVTVSAAVLGSDLLISVSDQGPGVPPEEADLIFRPFRSGALAGSSGVGLAISRAIVAAHGGTISVDEGPRGGARFQVVLPLR